MPKFESPESFSKSGLARLRDAEELLQEPTLLPNESGAKRRHLLGAMYLAGYGIENMLKAYIIRNNSCNTLSETIAKLEQQGMKTKDILGSSSGHNIRYLLNISGLDQFFNSEQRQHMSICAKWSSSWRYDVRIPGNEEALEFVTSVRSLVEWIRIRIS